MEKMAILITSDPELISAQPAEVFLNSLLGMSYLLKCGTMQMPSIILSPRAVCLCDNLLK